MGNRQFLTDNEMLNPLIIAKRRERSQPITLTGTLSLDEDCPPVQIMDANGAGRTVNLPPEASSKWMWLTIMNYTGAANSLTVKDSTSATTIATVAQNKIGVFFCDGTTWRGSPLP